MGWIGKTFVWTDEEIEFLKRNYSITKNKDLAKRLKTSTGAVSSEASALGLKKDSFVGRHKVYNAIRNHLDPLTDINEEVKALKKTVESIQKENLFEKYFIVVWGGMIGGAVVYTASLNDAHLLLRLGIILVIIFLGFIFAKFVKWLTNRSQKE
mgnify:CR=1 FL=1